MKNLTPLLPFHSLPGVIIFTSRLKIKWILRFLKSKKWCSYHNYVLTSPIFRPFPSVAAIVSFLGSNHYQKLVQRPVEPMKPHPHWITSVKSSIWNSLSFICGSLFAIRVDLLSAISSNAFKIYKIIPTLNSSKYCISSLLPFPNVRICRWGKGK